MGTLRLLLAFAVIISHTGPVRGFVGIGGSQAVMGFFIISGFYMHLVLDSTYRRSAGVFYANRALRLLPGFWMTLLIMAALAASGTTRIDGGYSRLVIHSVLDGSALAWLSIIPNTLIVGTDFFRELVANPKTGELLIRTRDLADDSAIRAADAYLLLPQMWSVANEIVFYALAPLLVRLRQGYFLLLVVAAYGGWEVSERANLYWVHLIPNFNLIFFMFGMTAYRAYSSLKNLPVPVLVVLSTFPFVYFLTNGAIDILMSPLVWVPFAIGVPALFEISKENRIDRFVGDLSYPVYLVHFIFAQRRLPPKFIAGQGMFVAAGSVVVSTAVVLFVERPIDRLRHGQTFTSMLRRFRYARATPISAIQGDRSN